MGWILAVVLAALAAAAALRASRRIGVRLARRVVRSQPRAATHIHGSTDTTVVLDADRLTLHPGRFGLWSGGGGHALVGAVVAHDRGAGTVMRELLGCSGDPPAEGSGYWTGHVHPGPEALGLPFREVSIPVPGGAAPAWRIEPAGREASSTWAVHIHGWSTDRITALRSVPAAAALGMTSLVVSFRGDGEAPPAHGGACTLGMREWEDVDAAVRYAIRNGAERIVLIGWSLGGAIALQLTERSAHRPAIDRVVLIGPVTDWRAVIRQGARAHGLPGWTGGLAISALSRRSTSASVGLAGPIDFDRLDWTRPGRLTVPALVIHSAGDRTVPLSSSLLFAMANPRLVRLVECAPAEHCWEYNVDPEAFDRAIADFLHPPP
jgi:uncharacterized protein